MCVSCVTLSTATSHKPEALLLPILVLLRGPPILTLSDDTLTISLTAHLSFINSTVLLLPVEKILKYTQGVMAALSTAWISVFICIEGISIFF